MPSLNRYEKVTCENFGTPTTKPKLARHKSRCSAGRLYCSQCPDFFTKSQNDLNYHIARKHSAPKHDITFKCKLCYAEFPGLYALRQHRNTQQGSQMGFKASSIDVEDIAGDVEDQSLREELESCRHFLTDTEMEKGRHRVFKFVMSSLDIPLLNDKLDYEFKELKCAAKLTLHLGSFRKILRMESVYILTLTRTILLRGSRKLCVHKLIWLTWKTECKKSILLIFVPEKEPIQSENYTDLQI